MGADTGIDGYYYYCKPNGKQTEAGIVSVKGNENPGLLGFDPLEAQRLAL